MATMRGDIGIAKLLMENGEAKETLNRLNLNPLTTAVRQDNTDMVKLLIERGVDLNGGVGEGKEISPLGQAAFHGNFVMVRLLLEAGADPNRGGIIQPLVQAVMRGDVAIVKLLLEHGADPLDGGKGLTAMAMAFDKPEIKALLRQAIGADMHQEAESGDLTAVLARLESGRAVDTPDEKGNTALMKAAQGGQAETVLALLDKGANVNATNYIGMTPLMFAVGKNRIDIVRILLERGADYAAINKFENSALWFAAIGQRRDIVTLLTAAGAKIGPVEAAALGDLDTLRQLLGWGADVNQAIPDSTTSLMAAARNGHLDCLQTLLTRGIGQFNKEGCTALALATLAKQKEAVLFLLDKGADINAAGVNQRDTQLRERLKRQLAEENLTDQREYLCEALVKGAAPLHGACLTDDVELVRLLLERGADIEQREGFQQMTPLMKAALMGHVETARLLLERGADVLAEDFGQETALRYAKRMKRNQEIIDLLQQAEEQARHELQQPS